MCCTTKGSSTAAIQERPFQSVDLYLYLYNSARQCNKRHKRNWAFCDAAYETPWNDLLRPVLHLLRVLNLEPRESPAQISLWDFALIPTILFFHSHCRVSICPWHLHGSSDKTSLPSVRKHICENAKYSWATSITSSGSNVFPNPHIFLAYNCWAS